MTPTWVILWPQWRYDLDRAVDFAQDAVREAAERLIASLDSEWEASAARSASWRSEGADVRPWLRCAGTDPHSGPPVASGWVGVDGMPAADRRTTYDGLIDSWNDAPQGGSV